MKNSITAGIDFGNQTSVLSIPTEKGIEIITNESSSRKTLTMVSYQERRRISGEFAQQQQMMNISNTITQIKRLVGLQYDSEERESISNEVPFKILRDNSQNGTIVIGLDNGEILKIEQIVGFYLKSLVQIIQKKNPNIKQIVLTVPPSWTEIQRRSILNAASISNVKIVKLINSELASAISYVKIHNDRFPEEHEKALNVLFIELGDTCMNTSVAKLSKKKVEMRSNFCDESIGGHFITEILEKYMMKKVVEKYKINPETNKRALIRFKQACEKAKKTLSSNPIVLFDVPSLMNDVDVSLTIKREEFNELIKSYISKIKYNIEKVIKDAGIKKDDLSFVEIVGGSSRIPLFKDAIKEIIGSEVKMSLDLDECFAIGAGYMAAKIDGFNIGVDFCSDYCPYNIFIKADKVKESANIFNNTMKIPLTTKAWIPIVKSQKLILLCDKGDIGNLIIKTGVDHKENVQILIKMDSFGVIDIDDATFKVRNKETNKIERKKCQSIIYTPLRSLTQKEICDFTKIEEKLSLQDKIETQIDDARNELESLIFSVENELKSIKIDQQLVDKFNEIHQWFSDNEFERLSLNEYQSRVNVLKQIIQLINSQKQAKQQKYNNKKSNANSINNEKELPEDDKRQVNAESKRKAQTQQETSSNTQRQQRSRNNARQQRRQIPRNLDFPFGF